MACTCSSCRRVHTWTIRNQHRVSTHVRTLPGAHAFRRYDRYPYVGLQGDATNAQSMAKCLEGISSVVLAFQGKSYFSAGRVDEGVGQLWHLHDLHGRLADPHSVLPGHAMWTCAGYQGCGNSGKGSWHHAHCAPVLSAGDGQAQVLKLQQQCEIHKIAHGALGDSCVATCGTVHIKQMHAA